MMRVLLTLALGGVDFFLGGSVIYGLVRTYAGVATADETLGVAINALVFTGINVIAIPRLVLSRPER